MNCGPLCLKYICETRFEEKVTLKKARTLCRVTRDGTTLENLSTAFRHLGHVAVAREKLTWSDLVFFHAQKQPIVVDWWNDLNGDGDAGDGHYSVIVQINDAAITLWDPDINGLRDLPRMVFEARWYDWDLVDNTRRDRVNSAVIILLRQD